METRLMRERLCPLHRQASDAHPGLLLQRGLSRHDEADQESKAKTALIERVCDREASDFYRRAYLRWRRVTDSAPRFRSVILKLETRLFIGLTGGGMLETGCAIGHAYGAPYIPGWGIKGVVSAHARARLESAANGPQICDELFGRGDPGALSGLTTFYDAWWVPDSAERPLVREVVTTHHPEYYRNDGDTPATDFDSPVPNAQVAVRGEFLFVIEGPDDWLDLAEKMLIAALSTQGAGAKTRAGYGLFGAKPIAPRRPPCDWVDARIADLSARNNASEEVTLRSQGLAEAWREIEDPKLKSAAFDDIRARWQEKGWWDAPPAGRSARNAKAIYDAYLQEPRSQIEDQ